MKQIDFVFRTILAELAQRIAVTPENEFDTEGRFVPVSVKGKRYWYFDGPAARGGKVRKYFGPDDDDTVRQTVTLFSEVKADAKARRKIVRILAREAKLPVPDPFVGKVVYSLAKAGIFESGGILLGANAYQCLAGYLGIELPKVPWEAEQPGISLSIQAAADIVTVRDILRTLDSSFAPQAVSGGQGGTRFINKDGFRIELAAPTLLRAYLVEEPVRTVMLYKSGVQVIVPSPQRYAFHELMMSARAGGDGGLIPAYSRVRALTLMESMLNVRRQADLAEAYEAAWNRNPTWREMIEHAMATIEDARQRTRIVNGLMEGMEDIGQPTELLKK